MASAFKGRATGSVAEPATPSEIERAARLLFDPANGVEIRVLPIGRSGVFRSTDIDAIGKFVAAQEDYTGIYYTLNPRPTV